MLSVEYFLVDSNIFKSVTIHQFVMSTFSWALILYMIDTQHQSCIPLLAGTAPRTGHEIPGSSDWVRIHDL